MPCITSIAIAVIRLFEIFLIYLVSGSERPVITNKEKRNGVILTLASEAASLA